MKNVLITGVSGYIGMKVAEALAKNDRVSKVVGIDIRRPPRIPGKLVFQKHDVRDALTGLLETHEIDTIIHTAYVVTPLHSKAQMEDINISGSRNVFQAAAQTGVAHLLYTSSATAYGFYPDNDVPLTEDSPLRANGDFIYAKNKKEIEEELIQPLVWENPDMTVTVLRPSFVAGPGFLANPLARHLAKPIVLLLKETAPLQFVHEDDLVRIVVMCLEKSIGGVFNVAGKGALSFPEMVQMQGNRLLTIPPALFYPLNNLAWLFRLSFLTEFPSPCIDLVRHSWVISPRRLVEATGFEYAYDSRGAFADFARSVEKD